MNGIDSWKQWNRYPSKDNSMDEKLQYLFDPRGCAVFGASSDPLKAGHQVVKNILDSGYKGPVTPVSLKGQDILGLKGAVSIADISHAVEMVVMCAPAKTTPMFLEQMNRRMDERGDIQAIITAAAGFAEVGTPEGIAFQEDLKNFCASRGIRMIGPNCVGAVDARSPLNATFIADIALKPGGISFVSQSGAVGAWLLMNWRSSPSGAVGFNKFVTVGNMADVDIIESLEFVGQDPKTTVMGLYIEGSPRARKLVETLGEIAKKKPVVVLKVGKTSEGAHAAASHTGSLAGNDAVYDGAFRQHGIIRVHSIDELSDTIRAFDSLPLPKGNRFFVLTQAGGPGVFCVDEMSERGGFERPFISPESKDALRRVLPPIASVCEPEGHADITAAATAEQHVRSLEVLLRDSQVDGVFFITVATLFLDLETMAEGIIVLLEQLASEGIRKPVIPVIISGDWVKPARAILEKNLLPTFESPDRGVQAVSHLLAYAKQAGICIEGSENL